MIICQIVSQSSSVLPGSTGRCFNTLYPFLFAIVQQKSGDEDYVYLSGTGSLLCGSVAGICAKTFVYPLDVARKRLQIQGFQHGRIGFGKVCNIRSGTDIMLNTVLRTVILLYESDSLCSMQW
jgi:hypothetical protein